MLPYDPRLKRAARRLRGNMTDAERLLWHHLRRKQIDGVQFYRQKPIGRFIVDFFAPAAGIVVEVDGGQHWEPRQAAADEARTAYLEREGLRVLRFSNLEVLRQLDVVLEAIFAAVAERRR